MARPIAGDLPAAPVSPYQTPPNGLPAPATPSPFNYTNQPSLPVPTVQTTPTPSGLLNAFRRRWVLSTFLGGLVAAAVAIGLWMVMPSGKHQARAIVQLRPKSVEFLSKNQEDFEAYRRHQMFLLKTRDLLTRTLADPAVVSLDSIKQADDPVTMLEEQIKVTVLAPEILEVTMTGNNTEDMKVIINCLIQKYVDDAVREDSEERDRQVRKLEGLRDSLKVEVQEMERSIHRLATANGTSGGESDATRLALLQNRYIRTDGDYNQTLPRPEYTRSPAQGS